MLVAIALPLACAIWGLRYFRLLPPAFRVVVAQCILAALVEAVSYYLVKVNREPTQWLYNYYILGECWLLCLAAGFMGKKVVLAGVLGALTGTAVWLVSFFHRGHDTFFYELGIVLAFIHFSIYAALLYQFSQQNRPFLRIREVWLCIAIIIFFTGTMPVLAILKLAIKRNQIVSLNIYYIFKALGVIRYTLVFLSLNSFGKLTKTDPPLARL